MRVFCDNMIKAQIMLFSQKSSSVTVRCRKIRYRKGSPSQKVAKELPWDYR